MKSAHLHLLLCASVPCNDDIVAAVQVAVDNGLSAILYERANQMQMNNSFFLPKSYYVHLPLLMIFGIDCTFTR